MVDRDDIIKVEILIEAKTEEDLLFIADDMFRNFKSRNTLSEAYYTNGGYLSFKKLGNSDTFRRNLLLKDFGWEL